MGQNREWFAPTSTSSAISSQYAVPELLQEIAECMFTFSVRGQYPEVYLTRESLVEYGLARFNRAKKATIQEPMAFLSIIRFFEKKKYTLYKNIGRRILTSTDPPVK